MTPRRLTSPVETYARGNGKLDGLTPRRLTSPVETFGQGSPKLLERGRRSRRWLASPVKPCNFLRRSLFRCLGLGSHRRWKLQVPLYSFESGGGHISASAGGNGMAPGEQAACETPASAPRRRWKPVQAPTPRPYARRGSDPPYRCGSDPPYRCGSARLHRPRHATPTLARAPSVTEPLSPTRGAVATFGLIV